MTVENDNGMSIRQYLDQGEIWVDDKTGNTFQISQMAQDRRMGAARQLVRTATALITQAEAEANQALELRTALRLVRQSPRDWVLRTALYRALYPGPEDGGMAETPGNRTGTQGVVHTDNDVLTP